MLGRIRINGKKRDQAYVIVPGLEVDVLVDGIKSRNRVLNGDIVAVELAPSEAWEEKGRRGGASSASESEAPKGFQRKRTTAGGLARGASSGDGSASGGGGDTPAPPTPLPRGQVLADPGSSGVAAGAGDDETGEDEE